MSNPAQNEDQLTNIVCNVLRARLAPLHVETKKSLYYALTIDETGKMEWRRDSEKVPVRGGGSAFEQDILVYEIATGSDRETSTVPRIAIEVKYGGITTHDCLTYSEKARQIRQIYPYIRYGLLIGNVDFVPARAVRLGMEFDFISILPKVIDDTALNGFSDLVQSELKTSQQLSQIRSGKTKLSGIRRPLKWTPVLTNNTHETIASDLDAIVQVSPNIHSGEPVFAGTRVPVQNLLDYLSGGDSIEDFVTDFPSVSREQIGGLLTRLGILLHEQSTAKSIAA